MKKTIGLLTATFLTAKALFAPTLLAQEQGLDQKVLYGLKCPGLEIKFSGPRFADKIIFEPTQKFFEGVLSAHELNRSLHGLQFNMTTQIGTCQKGEGSELVHCFSLGDNPHKRFASVVFSYSEEIENSEFLQTVTIDRGIWLTSWDLRVVTYPEMDPRTQKENTAAKLVFKGQIKSNEGIKEVDYQQRVGQWLDPIPSNRSEYGLCLFK